MINYYRNYKKVNNNTKTSPHRMMTTKRFIYLLLFNNDDHDLFFVIHVGYQHEEFHQRIVQIHTTLPRSSDMPTGLPTMLHDTKWGVHIWRRHDFKLEET